MEEAPGSPNKWMAHGGKRQSEVGGKSGRSSPGKVAFRDSNVANRASISSIKNSTGAGGRNYGTGKKEGFRNSVVESIGEGLHQSSKVEDGSGIQESQYTFLNERDVEMDNLKTIIIALNQKVKSRDDLERELAECQKNIKLCEDARGDLRAQIEESTEAIREHQNKNEKFQELIIEENKNWNLVSQEKDQIINNKDQEINELKQALSQKDREMNEMLLQLANLEDVHEQNQRLQDETRQLTDHRKKLQKDFENTLNQHHQ